MTETKQCCRCDKLKPITEFALKYPKRMIYQSHCRDCQKLISREHYLRNKQAIIERSAANKKATQARLAAIAQKALCGQRCADCGSEGDLTFYARRDYQGPRVSAAINSGLAEATLHESIAHSIVLCRTCLYQRGGEALKEFYYGSDTREVRIAERAALDDKPSSSDYKRRRTTVKNDRRLSGTRTSA